MKNEIRRTVGCVALVVAVAAATTQAQETAKPAAGVKLPAVVKSLLQVSKPCPNCDAAQTWVGRKPTPLPSPLPARSTGQKPSVALQSNPIDEMTWEQIRLLLPVNLRGDLNHKDH